MCIEKCGSFELFRNAGRGKARQHSVNGGEDDVAPGLSRPPAYGSTWARRRLVGRGRKFVFAAVAFTGAGFFGFNGPASAAPGGSIDGSVSAEGDKETRPDSDESSSDSFGDGSEDREKEPTAKHQTASVANNDPLEAFGGSGPEEAPAIENQADPLQASDGSEPEEAPAVEVLVDPVVSELVVDDETLDEMRRIQAIGDQLFDASPEDDRPADSLQEPFVIDSGANPIAIGWDDTTQSTVIDTTTTPEPGSLVDNYGNTQPSQDKVAESNARGAREAEEARMRQNQLSPLTNPPSTEPADDETVTPAVSETEAEPVRAIDTNLAFNTLAAPGHLEPGSPEFIDYLQTALDDPAAMDRAPVTITEAAQNTSQALETVAMNVTPGQTLTDAQTAFQTGETTTGIGLIALGALELTPAKPVILGGKTLKATTLATDAAKLATDNPKTAGAVIGTSLVLGTNQLLPDTTTQQGPNHTGTPTPEIASPGAYQGRPNQPNNEPTITTGTPPPSNPTTTPTGNDNQAIPKPGLIGQPAPPENLLGPNVMHNTTTEDPTNNTTTTEETTTEETTTTPTNDDTNNTPNEETTATDPNATDPNATESPTIETLTTQLQTAKDQYQNLLDQGEGAYNWYRRYSQPEDSERLARANSEIVAARTNLEILEERYLSAAEASFGYEASRSISADSDQQLRRLSEGEVWTLKLEALDNLKSLAGLHQFEQTRRTQTSFGEEETQALEALGQKVLQAGAWLQALERYPDERAGDLVYTGIPKEGGEGVVFDVGNGKVVKILKGTRDKALDDEAAEKVHHHNLLRNLAIDSNGNPVGHLIPRHGIRTDVPGGFEMDEIPVGEAGYLSASDLDSDAYFRAFDNLKSIYIGLAKQGIRSELHGGNVTFDEEGNVTALFDFPPGPIEPSGTIHSNKVLEKKFAQDFFNANEQWATAIENTEQEVADVLFGIESDPAGSVSTAAAAVVAADVKHETLIGARVAAEDRFLKDRSYENHEAVNKALYQENTALEELRSIARRYKESATAEDNGVKQAEERAATDPHAVEPPTAEDLMVQLQTAADEYQGLLEGAQEAYDWYRTFRHDENEQRFSEARGLAEAAKTELNALERRYRERVPAADDASTTEEAQLVSDGGIDVSPEALWQRKLEAFDELERLTRLRSPQHLPIAEFAGTPLAGSDEEQISRQIRDAELDLQAIENYPDKAAGGLAYIGRPKAGSFGTFFDVGGGKAVKILHDKDGVDRDKQADKIVEITNRIRETATDSRGNKIGHLIPEHWTNDVPGGFGMEIVPIGQPGYVNANDLEEKAFLNAFDNLKSIYIGLARQGIETDFHNNNVTFDEQGNVTALYDFPPTEVPPAKEPKKVLEKAFSAEFKNDNPAWAKPIAKLELEVADMLIHIQAQPDTENSPDAAELLTADAKHETLAEARLAAEDRYNQRRSKDNRQAMLIARSEEKKALVDLHIAAHRYRYGR